MASTWSRLGAFGCFGALPFRRVNGVGDTNVTDVDPRPCVSAGVCPWCQGLWIRPHPRILAPSPGEGPVVRLPRGARICGRSGTATD